MLYSNLKLDPFNFKYFPFICCQMLWRNVHLLVQLTHHSGETAFNRSWWQFRRTKPLSILIKKWPLSQVVSYLIIHQNEQRLPQNSRSVTDDKEELRNASVCCALQDNLAFVLLLSIFACPFFKGTIQSTPIKRWQPFQKYIIYQI